MMRMVSYGIKVITKTVLHGECLWYNENGQLEETGKYTKTVN